MGSLHGPAYQENPIITSILAGQIQVLWRRSGSKSSFKLGHMERCTWSTNWTVQSWPVILIVHTPIPFSSQKETHPPSSVWSKMAWLILVVQIGVVGAADTVWRTGAVSVETDTIAMLQIMLWEKTGGCIVAAKQQYGDGERHIRATSQLACNGL